MFINLEEANAGRVRMANNSVSEIKGVGSVRFENPDGTTFVLHDVRYMPEISQNLISLGWLEDKGCDFKGSNGVLKVIKGCTVFMRGLRKHSLYILQGEARRSESNSAGSDSEKSVLSQEQTMMWHSRLGHIGHKGLEELAKKGCLEGKGITEYKFCEDCVMGKTQRVSFGTAQHVTTNKLDYVHSDLWGSPKVPFSLSKCQYFISFTDDFSRKVWIYFLRFKHEAFSNFKEWKQMVETQSERKVKRLRTDNGLEFCNREFDGFCKQEGIVRHRTCTYTPQQNGVAERLNRTIMNEVRSMLSESGMGLKFWAEAAATAVYLINRSPSSAIEFKVPEEVWTSVMPSFTGLRRFGCLVYIHTDDGKLKPRAKRGVFTGYPSGVKGFKVWLLDEQKCVISRNVVFREDKLYKHLSKEDEVSQDLQGTPEPKLVSFEMGNTSGEPMSDVQDGDVTPIPEVSDDATQAPVVGSEESLSDYLLSRDRVRRQVVPPAKLGDYECEFITAYEEEFTVLMCVLAEDGGSEPGSFQEAMRDADRDKWLEAAKEEMTSLIKNRTWKLIDRPVGKKVIECRWLFKRKPGILGVEDPRHKARLVTKGYSQKEGVNYQEIFAPVVKHVSIRYMLSAVVHHDKVCQLERSLYGLKQSPRQWNKRFDDFMKVIQFNRSEYDNCVYYKEIKKTNEYIYLLLYVDDILIASKNKEEVKALKILLNSEFEMKDLGDAKKILGMEIERDRSDGYLWISQESYLRRVLSNFKMDQCKPVATPMGAHFKLKTPSDKEYQEEVESMRNISYQSAVGSIMYAMIETRPDLAYSLSLISRFMSRSHHEHWSAVKWVLRYIQGSIDTRLCYRKHGDFVVKGYCDSDYAADLDCIHGRRQYYKLEITASTGSCSLNH